MGGSKCRRVVQAVADHQHFSALGLELLELGDLAIGSCLAGPVVDPCKECCSAHGSLAIAGEQEDPIPGAAQSGDHLPRIGPHGVVEAKADRLPRRFGVPERSDVPALATTIDPGCRPETTLSVGAEAAAQAGCLTSTAGAAASRVREQPATAFE
jgi:hypothetical protein